MEDLNMQPLEGFEPTSKDGKALMALFSSFFKKLAASPSGSVQGNAEGIWENLHSTFNAD